MQFSQNQVQHLFVVKNIVESNLGASASKGDIVLVSNEKAVNFSKAKEMFFQYKGAKGSYRTDLIKMDQILSIKFVDGDDDSQKRLLKTWKVQVSTNALAAVGQVCILRLTFRNWIGMSDLDIYTKDVAVKITQGMTAATFAAKLKTALDQSFARELDKVLEFSVSEDELVIKETRSAEDNWVRGISAVAPINLTVAADIITVAGGIEETWLDAAHRDPKDESILGAKVKMVNSTEEVTNAKTMADLEYFCMGNRGDMYRGMGYPNTIPTEYLVTDTDTTKDKYDYLNIHYYFVGDGVQSAKSEKDITLIAKKGTIDMKTSFYDKIVANTYFKGDASAIKTE